MYITIGLSVFNHLFLNLSSEYTGELYTLIFQDVIQTIGEVPTDSRTAVPKKTVKIIDCGVVGIEKKYELTEEQATSDSDL